MSGPGGRVQQGRSMDSDDNGPVRYKLGNSKLLRHALCGNQQREDSWKKGWGGDHPQDSAIHWTGSNISIDRILNCAKKMNGQLCKAVIKRDKWVEHLKKKAEHTAKQLVREEARMGASQDIFRCITTFVREDSVS
eukprot:scaffold7857_cov103-Skeletonema_marinoi.AAC.1